MIKALKTPVEDLQKPLAEKLRPAQKDAGVDTDKKALDKEEIKKQKTKSCSKGLGIKSKRYESIKSK